MPTQSISADLIREFEDSCGQFKRVLEDSGLITLHRVCDEELTGTIDQAGLLEQYCFLLKPGEKPVLKDIHFKDGLRIGDQHCQLYTLADADELPTQCDARLTYDKYSTDKTKFSTGFVSPIGALLDCNHIYNQYLFIEDATKTLKKLEAKKLRLRSLSAYSRENAIGHDATAAFIDEAISQQRLPVKAHLTFSPGVNLKTFVIRSVRLSRNWMQSKTRNRWRAPALVGLPAWQCRRLSDE